MLIAMRGTEKSFGPHRVLAGVDLSVQQGEVYGLLGDNGAGKSTIINILTGLIGYDAGEILVAGRPPSTRVRSVIGVAPQEIALYRHLTVRENLRFFGGIYHVRGAALVRQVGRVIDFLDLRRYADSCISTLSGGWQRRVNLAVAIVHSPAIVFLDEPTAGLDVQARSQVWDFVRRLRHGGTTIFLTTHSMDEAEALCDRVGILHGGRIVREGSVGALCREVPAVELAEVKAEEIVPVLEQAAALGIPTRQYAGVLTLLLPRHSSLADLVNQFQGISIRSVTLRPVGLLQAYLELTKAEFVAAPASQLRH